MYYCTKINGQNQPVGPSSQVVHAATPITDGSIGTNQQVGTNISFQLWTGNLLVQPQQNGHVNFQDGTQPNRQMSNRQTSAVPHQAVSSQSTVRLNNNNVLFRKYPKLATILGVNPSLPYQNSTQNSKIETPTKKFTTYYHQNTSAHLNQPVSSHAKQSIRTHDVQNHGVQNNQLVSTGQLTYRHPSYITTAPWVPCKPIGCTGTIQQTNPTANNQNCQNVSQHRFPSPILPTYSQSLQQKSIATKAPSSGPIWCYNNAGMASSSSIISNQLPLKATADAQQQRPDQVEEAMIIAGFAESLRKSYTADSGGHHPDKTSSPSTWRQLIRPPSQVGKVEMMECNQTMQPVTSAAQRSNLTARQTLKVLSNKICLRDSVKSPQQSSSPYVYSVTNEEGIIDGNKKNASFAQNNSISKENVVKSSSDVFQFMHLPEGTSLQRTESQFSVKNNREMLCSATINDNSIHSSLSRTGTRVVAVVQPLSQENYQVVKKHNPSDTVKHLKECTTKCVSLSNCTHLQDGPQDKTQNQLNADEKGSELSSYQSVEQAAQQSVTSEGPEGQNGDMNKAEVPLDQNTSDLDLSSIPTIQWTINKLHNFTMGYENRQMETQDGKRLHSVEDVLKLFWNNNIDSFKHKIRSGWYRRITSDVNTFCREHVTVNSTILSEVKESHWKQLESYRVLKHNETHSELPYQSSWLNVNEQVDDIDKEFGYSWTLRRPTRPLEIESQLDEFEATMSISAQILSDVSSEAVTETELRSVDLGEGKQASTVELTASQVYSPNETDCGDSSDQHYSFEIEVLSPEEAKAIFGRMQSMETQSQPENVMKSSIEDELPNVGDTLKVSKQESKKKTPVIDEFCCLAGWIENVLGTDTFKCACKDKQGQKDCTAKTLDKETVVQTNDQPSAIRLDNVHSVMERDHQMNAEEIIDSQVVPCCKETKKMSLAMRDDSQLNTIVFSDKEVEDVSCSGSEIANKCVREQLKSAGSGQSSNSDKSKREFTKAVDIDHASHKSDAEDGCPQVQLTSTDVTESPLEVEETTRSGPAADIQTPSGLCEKLKRKRKTLHSDEEMFTLLKKVKKRRPVNLESEPVFKGVKCKKGSAESKPLDSQSKTAQLVLYGSTRQGECKLIGDRRSVYGCAASPAAHRPPNVIFVNLDPTNRKSSDPTPEYSVKSQIYEKWRRSFLPTTIRHRKKLKTLQCTLPWTSLKKAEKACPSNTKELAACSERKREGNTDCRLKQKKRRLLSGVKLAEEGTRKDVGTLQPDQERSTSGGLAIAPVEEKYVLRFSVLPRTFSFADALTARKEPKGDSDATGENSRQNYRRGNRNMVTSS